MEENLWRIENIYVLGEELLGLCYLFVEIEMLVVLKFFLVGGSVVYKIRGIRVYI